MKKSVSLKILNTVLFACLPVFLLAGQLFAFSLSMSTNAIHIGGTATVTLDVSPAAVNSYTYEWSATTGTITGTSNSVTYTAPNVKSRPEISVTAKSGTATAYQGTIAVLVYKNIFVIKNDDFDFADWASTNCYTRPNWQTYLNYMESIHCKTSVGIICMNLDDAGADATAAPVYFKYLKDMANRGYVSYYSHSYYHVILTDSFDDSLQLPELLMAQAAAKKWLDIDLQGYGAPGNKSDTMTVAGLNQIPEIKYYFYPECSMLTKAQASLYTGYIFYNADTGINAETSSPQHVDYPSFLTSYATNITSKNRPINVIQVHPPWWDNVNAKGYYDLTEWDKIITYLRSHGDTILSPMDIVMMVSSPTFVPSESASTSTTTTVDTMSPTAPGTVRDGTGAADSAIGSTTTLSANWNAASDAVGVTKYWYAIGTTPGGTNTIAWTDAGNVLTVTRTAPSALPEGVTYYFTVKAQDAAGNQSSAANSNGQVTPRGKISGSGGGGTGNGTGSTTVGRAYPNPTSLSGNALTKFSISSAGGEVSVYTISGRLIKTFTAATGAGTINWDGKNSDGEKVKPGIYTYIIKENSGNTWTGKIVLKK